MKKVDFISEGYQSIFVVCKFNAFWSILIKIKRFVQKRMENKTRESKSDTYLNLK